jgi:hypothetical protein
MDFVARPLNVVVTFATPPVSVAVPRSEVPFMKNLTLPVGVPADEETVAVKITGCPTVAGFFEEDKATCVGAGFTT